MNVLDPRSTCRSAWAARVCATIADARPGTDELITIGLALDEMDPGDEHFALLNKWLFLRAAFLAATVSQLNWVKGFQQ